MVLVYLTRPSRDCQTLPGSYTESSSRGRQGVDSFPAEVSKRRRQRHLSVTYVSDTEFLQATVPLSGNLSFLSLISQNGLSYLPQRLSYSSLLSALGSIWVGLAVRTPRFLPDSSIFCFEVMVCILALPFVLFLYSIIFFISALIAHFSTNTATEETFVASLVVGFLIMCLILYWLITVPSEVLPVEGAAGGGQA